MLTIKELDAKNEEERKKFIRLYKAYEKELREIGADIPEWSKEDEFTFARIKNDSDYVYFENDKGEYVGFANLGTNSNTFSSLKGEVYIQDFCILKKYRRKGYGTEAIKLIQKKYKTFSLYVYKKNDTAVKFWGKMFDGYEDKTKTVGIRCNNGFVFHYFVK